MANYLLISADQWQAAPILRVKGDADMDMQVWRRNDHGTKNASAIKRGGTAHDIL